MSNSKLHSSVPFFFLTALLGLVPVLNNKYPAAFFPALSSGIIELLSVTLGISAAAMAWTRLWARLVQRDRASRLVRQAAEVRQLSGNQDQNELVNAGRIISRLVRNADEDLREINPDFTLESLGRLQQYLPDLMSEVDNEEDANIRLGVVGIYLGETLCRHSGWKWFFRADPALRQFSYMASVLRKDEREWDPFAWAADLLTKKRRMNEILKDAKTNI